MPAWQEAFPAVNRALAPQLRTLPTDQVEAILHEAFGEGFGLEAAEGFFDDIGSTLSAAARAAAPVVQRALPGIVSGAAGGAALGPMGMLGGALLGGVGSALGGGQPPAGAAAPAAPGIAQAPAGRPAAAPSGPTAAVAQLLAVLGSPTVQQALNAMMLGGAGARTVAGTTGSQLPVAAITNLLGTLAGRASAEWEMVVPSEALGEGYAESVDMGSPESRGAWIFERLSPPPAAHAAHESTDATWVDDLYDDYDAQMAALDDATEWSTVDG